MILKIHSSLGEKRKIRRRRFQNQLSGVITCNISIDSASINSLTGLLFLEIDRICRKSKPHLYSRPWRVLAGSFPAQQVTGQLLSGGRAGGKADRVGALLCRFHRSLSEDLSSLALTWNTFIPRQTPTFLFDIAPWDECVAKL